jgi:hypothetical protein
MPTVIITNLSPGELVGQAIEQANEAAREIHELATSPFEPGETVLDRALLVARHAFALAEAWSVIDTMARTVTDSPPTSAPPPRANGVHDEAN